MDAGLTAFLQVAVQIADGRELSHELRSSGPQQFAASSEVTPAEEVVRRDYRRSHRVVLVSALRPRQIVVEPKIESHVSRSRGCRAELFGSGLGNLEMAQAVGVPRDAAKQGFGELLPVLRLAQERLFA